MGINSEEELEYYCTHSLPCDKAVERVESDSLIKFGFNHSQHINTVVSLPFSAGEVLPYIKFDREYEARWDESGDPNIYAVIRGAGPDAINCYKKPRTYNLGGHVSESCEQTIMTVMYLDLTHKIMVYKLTHETVKFSVNVHPVKAKFQSKFNGRIGYWKFVIHGTKGSEALQGDTTYHVMSIDPEQNKVIDNTIHTYKYEKNPFPAATYTGTWGLYGGTVINTAGCSKDETVRQILIYPQPGRMMIPRDYDPGCCPSVNDYGFYDYGQVDDGFVESGLGKDDGGQDMFYPAWIRAMAPNAIMRVWADQRWDYRWNHIGKTSGDNIDWSPPWPDTYGLPFGSFIMDRNYNYMHSALFPHLANGLDPIIYNRSYPEDMLTNALKLVHADLEKQVVCTPITIISDVLRVPSTTEETLTPATNPVTDDSGNPLTDDSGSPLNA